MIKIINNSVRLINEDIDPNKQRDLIDDSDVKDETDDKKPLNSCDELPDDTTDKKEEECTQPADTSFKSSTPINPTDEDDPNKIISLDDPLKEYANYYDAPEVATDIARVITGYSFEYVGKLLSAKEDYELAVKVVVDINEDDISAIMSDNIVYVYLNINKVNYHIEFLKDSLLNNNEFLRNNEVILKRNRFIKHHPKAWRDDVKLYLLKMNMNSGLIGRFDPYTDKFVNQKLANWKTSTNKDVARILLTKEYLHEYFMTELANLKSYVDFDFNTEINNSKEV